MIYNYKYLNGWTINNDGSIIIWVKGCIYDTRRVVWTNSDIFQSEKLICNVPNNDEQDFIRFY